MKDQIEALRARAEELRTDIYSLLEANTGPGRYDPKNADCIDGLHKANGAASDCRLHLMVAKRAA